METWVAPLSAEQIQHVRQTALLTLHARLTELRAAVIADYTAAAERAERAVQNCDAALVVARSLAGADAVEQISVARWYLHDNLADRAAVEIEETTELMLLDELMKRVEREALAAIS